MLGTPGSGKSFFAKREMANAFFATDDHILILDAENEYTALTEQLQGQNIYLAPDSHSYLNPMDLDLSTDVGESPMLMQADFLLSQCELMMASYGNPLMPIEKSLIDRCISLVYRDYLKNPVPGNMPILGDLYQCLREQHNARADDLATAMEIYVTGSLSYLNHRTNVDLNNRLVCYNISKLGQGLELYTMMRYLQYDLLRSSGLEHFDSWAANFGETVTALEMAPEGTGFRSKTRFAKFFNLPELMAMWRESADIQTAEMLHLPVPEAEKITIVTKPSDFQRDLVEDLGERAEAVRSREVEPREDNMLKITSDGRKLALDQRLAVPALPDDPESKINACVRNVLQVWRDTEEIKGTQLVFCDLSTPKNDGSFNAYDDIKQKLMAQGVPPEEIAFIHDAKTEVQKAELFARVRKGQVRVLLGSTAKMGAGTNVQTRLAALHHLDCPWRPADIEQREGRILRQGNMNETVKIFKYVTENTFDAYNWSILENKQKFIGQLMSGKNPSRSCEDVDEAALSYAEVKALASGDPRIIEMTDLDSQVTKLKLLKANHEGQRYMLEDRLIQFFPQAIRRRQEQIKGLEADLAVVQAHPQPDKDHFSIRVSGQTFTERKAAGQAIIDACTRMNDVSERVDLGEYRGFPLTLWADTNTQKFQVTMKQSLSHTIELGSDPVGNMARLDNALAAIDEELQNTRADLENLTAQMEEAKVEVQRPFPQEQELNEKTSRLNVLRIALNMDGKATGKRKRETEELDGGKPSIKGMLKRLGVESAATASAPQKGKDMEVAI